MRKVSFCMIGIFTIVLPSMMPPLIVVSVSSNGADACTSTESATLPTSKITSNLGCSFVRSSIPVRTYFLNPCDSTVMLYAPGRRYGTK